MTLHLRRASAVTAAPAVSRSRWLRGRVASRVALLAVLASWLAALVVLLGTDLPAAVAVRALAGSRFAGAVLGPGATVALLAVLASVAFVPVGGLCVALLRPRPHRDLRVGRVSASLLHLLAFLLGLVACACAWSAAAGIASLLPGPLSWGLPWGLPWALPVGVGVLVGALACPVNRARPGPRTPAQRGCDLFAGLLLRAAVVAAALAACVFAAAWLLLAPARMHVQPAPVAAHLEQVVRSRLGALNPLQLGPGRQAVANFSPSEVQVLLQRALRRVDAGARVRVEVEVGNEPARGVPGMRHGSLGVRVSVRPPLPSSLSLLAAWRPYLDLSASIAVGLRDGELVFDRCLLVLGRVRLARGACAALLGGWHVGAGDVAGALPSVGALDALQVDARGAALVYRRLELHPDTRRALQRLLGPGDDVVAAVRAQLLAMHQHAPRLQASGDRFRAALQLAFRVAQLRSRVGDAAAENQGAVLALAMVFGDADVALAAGLPRESEVARLATRIGPAHLWGRADWGQHFLISAALAQVATASLSDVAGLAKEQLDADGGSGFAFTDLLADRAGTLFGRRLAADEASARRVQAQVVDGWRLEDIMPSPAGLPEGLQAAAFGAEFGAVGSARYRAMEAEIARRLQTAALLVR